jgi:hypothetical protein
MGSKLANGAQTRRDCVCHDATPTVESHTMCHGIAVIGPLHDWAKSGISVPSLKYGSFASDAKAWRASPTQHVNPHGACAYACTQFLSSLVVRRVYNRRRVIVAANLSSVDECEVVRMRHYLQPMSELAAQHGTTTMCWHRPSYTLSIDAHNLEKMTHSALLG